MLQHMMQQHLLNHIVVVVVDQVVLTDLLIMVSDAAARVVGLASMTDRHQLQRNFA